MNALFAPGAKRTRFLVAFGLTLLLATPAVMIWAGKAQIVDPVGEESQFEQALLRDEARRLAGMNLPAAFVSPAEFSPFGGVLQPSRQGGKHGEPAWDRSQADWPAGMKPGLLWNDNELTKSEKGPMRPGQMYVRLSDAAEQNLDEALRSLADAATIISVLPNRTYLVNVEARNMHMLRQNPNVEKMVAREPAEKIAGDFGARPQMSKTRAADPNIHAQITLVPGVSTSEAAKAIAAIPGVSEVSESVFGGTLGLKIHYSKIDRLARNDDVLDIDTVRDITLFNAENVPTVQAGSAEDSLFIRPFDAAGVDGGGIDNGDGERINNGTDPVPPQIVIVIDNGISYDTPSFSQTATQTTTTVPLRNIGRTHRKVHAIQNGEDSGTSCDDALSGGSTHGNIVSSVIAAYPSQFGVFATRTGGGTANSSQPRNENLDGVARGARILMVDQANTTRCGVNSLVERGGELAPFVPEGDPGVSLIDRLNLTICPTAGGAGACAGIVGGGFETHVAVLPFGSPANFSTFQFQLTNGTYPSAAREVDMFLYNNRDMMLMVPVGNNGGLIGNNRLGLALRVIPDLFNGSALDENPNTPQRVQISPPATAKNVVSVGAGTADCFTFFGPTDCESANVGFTSKGPATPGSLRMAPLVTAPSFDLVGTPYTAAVAVFRSNDNDNLGSTPLDAQLDEGNFGSSYSAAYVTGAGALINDYFAQGFYPTGDRNDLDRVPRVSGAFVKAALAASATFQEGGLGTQGEDANEQNIRRSRALNLGTVSGQLGSVVVGVMGNSEQGYGRPVLTHVLPLANWNDNFTLHPNGVREYPAAGLLAFDRLATGEPLINNSNTSCTAPVASTASCSRVTHTFRVASNATITHANGAVAVTTGQLRIALAWPDMPSAVDSGPTPEGGQLVNDLDLVVESPGPDNCLTAADLKPNGAACPPTAADDNEFIDGNVYDGGRNSPVLDQWSRTRTASVGTEVHDFRNPVEAVHMTGDPDANLGFSDSHLYVGRWRATVRRGWGSNGAPENAITIIPTTDPDGDEDDNANGRLDAGEDNNTVPNGLLDQPGQPYSLIVAGPVFLAEGEPLAGPTGYPGSQITWSSIRFNCASNATLRILDTAAPLAGDIAARVSYQVRNAAGAVLDTESNFDYVAGDSPYEYVSETIPVRLAAPAFANNGVLETDSGQTVIATYTAPGQAPVTARAAVQCSPDLINAQFTTAGGNAFGEQWALNNGCDNDEFFDAGEIVTYGVALQNRSRTDFYADLTATLQASGPGADALTILDSPKVLGTMPGNATNGVFFHVKVDAAKANALSVANRKVTMTLTLDSLVKGQRVGRQTYSFDHAINADRESFFYSTDYPSTPPGGTREVRDLNRNLEIDPPDTVDPTLGFIVPREDVTFSTLFSGDGTLPGVFTNLLGEDLDNSGRICSGVTPPNQPCSIDADCAANGGDCLEHTGGERDIMPNGVLDRGILVDADPAGIDRVPWNFDSNNGGWVPFRHPGSTARNISDSPVWEYKTTGGLCGFQTSSGATFGIWHTGDGNPATPGGGATACDEHNMPREIGTPSKVELIFDILESPIISKVNQNNDTRGFPYTVEFQRFGFNENIQTFDGYAGGGVNIDNNVDSDNANSLLGQQMDAYYTRRAGGWPYTLFRDAGQYFTGPGIDPTGIAPFQRTFGPFVNGGAPGVIDAGDTGHSGNTDDSNPDSDNPIPTADPDFLPYPVPGAPEIGVCDNPGHATNDTTCDPNAPGTDPCLVAGGTCFEATNDVRGPARNFDATLIGYEGAFASLIDSAPPENFFFFTPGRAGNRWQIGIGFWSLESPSLETDYGKGVDDVVFEWVEYHPKDEGELGATPACARYNGPGLPQGGQCATLTADRTTLYECDEGLEITLYDSKCLTGPTPGAPCTTDAQCGGGDCIADNPTVNVQITTESDSVPVDYQGQQVFYPNTKTYPLSLVAGSPGLFRGTVIFSTTTDTADHVFNVPGSDSTFTVYYYDPFCDGDRDGQMNEDDFANVDGDGIADASDKCPQIYDPVHVAPFDCNGDGDTTDPSEGAGLQCDTDGDGHGELCDNCPSLSNSDQLDDNGDGVGNVCEFDDGDGVALSAGDGTPDVVDNCREVRNPEQTDSDGNGVGDLCDMQRAAFGSANGRRLHSFYYHLACGPDACSTGRCSITSDDACDVDSDCATLRCSGTPTRGCATDADCFAGQTCSVAVAAQVCNNRCAIQGTACNTDAECLQGNRCHYPTAAAGAACTTNEDCNRACNTNTGQCQASGTCLGFCLNGADPASSERRCTTNAECPTGETCNGNTACNFSETCTFGNSFNCVMDYTSPWVSAAVTGGTPTACTTNAQCHVTRDRDLDGVLDTQDNCILTPNPAPQTDTDNDDIGDACDPDCAGRIAYTRCTSNAAPAGSSCRNAGVSGEPYAYGPGQGYSENRTFTYRHTGACSPVNDDDDADGVEDPIDTCPVLSNLPIIAGTQRQRDSDRDGLGDVCDPPGTFDDFGDGVPDDVVTFNGTVACRTQALANFSVISTAYQDNVGGNGDQDAFPDTGETGRLQMTIQNLGVSLTDATIVLTSSDPDVQCVTRPSLLVGSIPAGAIVQFGDFVPGNPGLEFVAANAPELEFTGLGDDPELIDLCITVVANETLGTSQPICFSLLADLNAPPGVSQVFTNGPDGAFGTADDGTMVENFDIDKDGDGNITVNDTFLERTSANPAVYTGYCNTNPSVECDTAADCPAGEVTTVCYKGTYIKGTDVGGANTVQGVSCGGFQDEDTNPGGCILDPDFPFDWHVHCAVGATNCPNVETGTCVGGCSYNTPTGGQKSHSGANSLHMGAHFNQQNNLAGDATHFRTLQGYMSAPLNMALFPRAGDLQMSFYHIARLMDNNGVGPNNANQCVDCGDVQVQLDRNPDAAIDDWGFWDKLVPFQNVYDHKPNAWSVFGGYYCLFTPTDTGNEPPNPRAVQETLCYPLGAWSHCGSHVGTAITTTLQCLGPGELDPTGIGVWVQTKFNLSGFLGQRIRIRWIAETWNFANAESSYFEIGSGWDNTTQDDGWWLDDIEVRGTITQQVTPEADTEAQSASCAADPCDETVGDRGTNVVLKITDLNGNVIDGINTVQFAGQPIRVSAINTTLPGGCIGGVAEYEFTKKGAPGTNTDQVVQAFGPKSFYLDAPETNTTYFARARCSTDTIGPEACVSIIGATIDSGPYSGAGGDAFFGERASPASNVRGVEYFRGVCTAPAPAVGQPCNVGADCGVGGTCNVTASTADDVTRLRWWGPGNYGTDLMRGTVVSGPAPKGGISGTFWDLSGLASPCFLSNVAGTPVPGGPGTNYISGNLSQATDPNPALNAVVFYEVSTNSSVGGNLNAFGCANPGICGNAGWCELGSNSGAPCTGDAICGVGGYCANNRCTAGTASMIGRGCNLDAHCGAGGVCGATPGAPDPNVPAFCATDTGMATFGGCGRHRTCSGGTNANRICDTDANCGGGICTFLALNVSSPGNICQNLVGVNLPPPFGSCPTSGHPKKLIKRIGGAGMVCP